MAGGGAVFSEVPDNSITLAKLAHGTADRYLGFDGSGVPAELTVSSSVVASTSVMPHSTTIDDYSQPSGVSGASSESLITPFGSASNQAIEDFTTWADQAALDAAWITNDTAHIRATFANQLINAFAEGAFAGSSYVMYHDITGAILPDDVFEIRFKLNITAVDTTSGGGAYVAVHIALASGTGDWSTAQDRIALTISAAGSTKNYKVYETDNTSIAEGGTAFTRAAAVELVYVKIERTSLTSVTISLYSDAAYTTLLEAKTATIAATIQNLRYFSVLTYDNANAGDVTVEIDDIELLKVGDLATDINDDDVTTKWKSLQEVNPNVYVDLETSKNICGVAINLDRTTTTETQIQIQTTPDDPSGAATWTTRRTRNVSDFVDDADKFNRINVTAARAVRIRGSSGASVVLALNEVSILTKTDSEVSSGHGHLDIDETSVTVGDDGS